MHGSMHRKTQPRFLLYMIWQGQFPIRHHFCSIPFAIDGNSLQKILISFCKSIKLKGNEMSVVGEKENIGPAFGKSVHIDLNGAQITPADGFLLLREVDERLGLFEQ